jgi:hypothetical protein
MAGSGAAGRRQIIGNTQHDQVGLIYIARQRQTEVTVDIGKHRVAIKWLGIGHISPHYYLDWRQVYFLIDPDTLLSQIL